MLRARWRITLACLRGSSPRLTACSSPAAERWSTLRISAEDPISLASHVYQIMEQIGYLARGEVIWVKAKGAAGNCAWGSWLSARNPTLRDVHEYCLCFSKGRFGRLSKGESTISAEEFLAATLSVWEIPAESAKRVGHPAPFPVALPARLTELYTYKGDLVLDPFMGSGTTAVAAVRLARHFVGYEISADYLAAAERRIARETRVLTEDARERAGGGSPVGNESAGEAREERP